MKRQIKIFAVLTFLLVSHSPLLGVDKKFGRSLPLALSSVHFEQNVTDGDVEVVFEVENDDVGLTKLMVVSPDGRTVIDFSAPDVSTLGIRSFRFESPEPGNIESIKSAYPEGVYTFTGATIAGDIFYGQSTLNHKLPPAASFLRPGPGARGLDAKDLKITWTPVKNMAAYIIEIELDEKDVKIVAKVPGSVSTFAAPESILLPGMGYHLSIGTVSDEGNISFVETSFTTAR